MGRCPVKRDYNAGRTQQRGSHSTVAALQNRITPPPSRRAHEQDRRAGGHCAAGRAVATAHVSIRPRESRPSAEEKYTVRVPTEGQVATVSVELDIPEGVTVIDVPQPDGAKHEITKTGDRVTSIKWPREIPPKQSADFLFTARNPAGEQITWKVRQNFADGKSTPWTPGTKLVANPAAAPLPGGQTGTAQNAPASGEAAKIEAWLKGYDDAFNA
ncbi:MAG: DUF1775 domain-containing protein, partial [Acidobacteria bacterium]|nr:DUF1775 domain-containing protein [Acidobacteriota bacterium]